MPINEAQDQWLDKVMRAIGGRSGKLGSVALDGTWEGRAAVAAKSLDMADSLLETLRLALLLSEDLDLQEIGANDVPRVLGPHPRRLRKALSAAQIQGPAQRPNLEKLAASLDGFLKHLTDNEQVSACKENPEDIEIDLVETLEAPLKALYEDTTRVLSA